MSATRAAGVDRAAAWAFLVLVAVTSGPIAPMGIGVALCGALTLLALARGARPGWPRTPVDGPALLWLGAMLLAAMLAVDRGASLPRLSKALFPLLVGLGAYHAAHEMSGRRALAAYLAATGLVAAIAIAVWVWEGAGFDARARGLSGHYMTYAGQLLLALPVAIAVALSTRDPRWRRGASAVAVLGVVALTMTFTRSAWLGLFAACAVILGAIRPLGLVGLAAAGVAVFVFVPDPFRERLHSAFDPAHPWNRQRLFMWEAGLRMFRDHPWTGVGLQDLHALYDQYRSPQATEPVGHLHSTVVQVAASMGAVGLAAFAFLFGSLFRCALHGLAAQRRLGGLAAGLRLGVVAALAGFLVAGCFEWNFGDEELLYPLYLLAGMAWSARAWEDGGA